ncbi:MAG: DUF2249 domain-containing protein [Bacteroidetes bacterium]|nr:DUF2249 domain-containing protein [Bacteroidota bacterium]
MNAINVNTKIATILKEKPNALEAIISISPKFNKLRNPLLRKLMAPRTSISMACKIAGCSTADFFDKLLPYGFSVDRTIKQEEKNDKHPIPDFMKNVSDEAIIELDVRPIIEEGNDPLSLILKTIKHLKSGQIFKLINSFEPVPLIQLLEKQGYESHVESISSELTITYFHKKDNQTFCEPEIRTADENDWESILQIYIGKIATVDVRQLEMPLPMMTILSELDNLATDQALYVYHKRIPVFLLPELRERKFDYRIKELSENEVHLLIFRN